MNYYKYEKLKNELNKNYKKEKEKNIKEKLKKFNEELKDES